MSRHWLKLRLGSRVERLTMVPRVLDRRKSPEVAVWVPHNPLVATPVHQEGDKLFRRNAQVSSLLRPIAVPANIRRFPQCLAIKAMTMIWNNVKAGITITAAMPKQLPVATARLTATTCHFLVAHVI